ncbi:hypothetical protein RUND412_004328 [Rhizina undulata]
MAQRTAHERPLEISDAGHRSPAVGPSFRAAREEDVFSRYSQGLRDYLDNFAPSRDPSSPAQKAMVLGIGRGYDVLILAEHGYDVTGVDFYLESLSLATECIKSQVIRNAENNPDHWGDITLVAADFACWEDLGAPLEGFESLDLVYDCNYLINIPPAFRQVTAGWVAALLKKRTGRLVCVESAPEDTDEFFGDGSSARYDNMLGGSFDQLLRYEMSGNYSRNVGSVTVWVKKLGLNGIEEGISV